MSHIHNKARLASKEHYGIEWFSRADLSKKEYNLDANVKAYRGEAIRKFVK